MNIFKINKCKKKFFEKFPFFRGVALIKKNFFGQNFFAHVSGKNKKTEKTDNKMKKKKTTQTNTKNNVRYILTSY